MAHKIGIEPESLGLNALLTNPPHRIYPLLFAGDNVNEEVQKLVAGYTGEMETLRTKLLESEAMRNAMHKTNQRGIPSCNR